MQTNRKNYRTFMIAARVAAELHAVTRVARQMSLIAKNARYISARAGQQTITFNAITAFIDEMATTTIEQARRIDRVAVGLSRQAVLGARSEDARQRLERAVKLLPDKQYGVSDLMERLDTRVVAQRTQFVTILQQLSGMFEDVEKQSRAADMIASLSRIEATQAGAYQHSLENIAAEIDQAAGVMKNHLGHARRLLQAA